MFEETDSVLNTKSVPLNISYKFFNLSYCDHRKFDNVNQAGFTGLCQYADPVF